MKTRGKRTSELHWSVWVIEDNAAYRRNLVHFINTTSELWCEHEYGSCEDALDGLQQNPPPDVILLDIGLPGMSGIEGIQRIKSDSPAVQIIIITVYDDSENVFKAICAGASGYLLKTSTEERIVEAIRDVLVGGSPINAQIARKVLEKFSELNTPANDYLLSNREHQILELLVAGATKSQISARLYLSPHTVDTHVRGIYYKLQVHSRGAAVAKAIKERLL